MQLHQRGFEGAGGDLLRGGPQLLPQQEAVRDETAQDVAVAGNASAGKSAAVAAAIAAYLVRAAPEERAGLVIAPTDGALMSDLGLLRDFLGWYGPLISRLTRDRELLLQNCRILGIVSSLPITLEGRRFHWFWWDEPAREQQDVSRLANVFARIWIDDHRSWISGAYDALLPWVTRLPVRYVVHSLSEPLCKEAR
jgi:hypothetical protein